MAGYVLQSTLLVRYVRRIDASNLIFYRSLTLGVTLSPLLFFLQPGDVQHLVIALPVLLLSGIAGTLYLWCSYTSIRSLPVGSNSALIASSSTVSVLLYSVFFTNEYLSSIKVVLILLIVVCSFILGFSPRTFDHLDGKVMRGIVLTLLAGLPGAATKILLGTLTQTVTPLVAAYAWELSIGVMSALFLFISSGRKQANVHAISLKTLVLIMLCSAPTLIGTGAFALALPLGNLSILQAIGSGGSIVLSGVISHALYHEHMSARQWVPIVCIAILISLMKIV